jgi:hypothetical protein
MLIRGQAQVEADELPIFLLGLTHTVTLSEAEPAVYRGKIATSVSGVYRVRVRATGADLRGSRFTREELRTLAVWAGGDDAPPVITGPAGDCWNGTKSTPTWLAAA